MNSYGLDFITNRPSYSGFDEIMNVLVLQVFINEVNEVIFALTVPPHMHHHLVFDHILNLML